MNALVPILFAFLLAFYSYKQAKRRGEWAWSRFFIRIGAIVAFFCGFMTPAHAQSLYKDPAGAFTVRVPAGWQTQREAGSPMVSFTSEKSQASVSMGVIPGPAANTPTAEKELESIQSRFPQNCPQARVKQRGPTTLGGISGAFLLVNCTNGQGGLEVRELAPAFFTADWSAVCEPRQRSRRGAPIIRVLPWVGM